MRRFLSRRCQNEYQGQWDKLACHSSRSQYLSLAYSPEKSSCATVRSPGAPSAPERRSSRLSKPPEAPPSLRVRRSTRLEKVPRKRFIESDSESPSPSSESSTSDEEDEDSDDDFAETDEDAPTLDRAQSNPQPRSNTRSSSHSQPNKNVANTGRTRIPFVLVQTRTRSLRKPFVPLAECKQRSTPGSAALARDPKERQDVPIADPTPMVLSPSILSSTSAEGSRNDEVDDYSANAGAKHPSSEPDNHVRVRRETSALLDETELEDCALAPRLKRKREKLHDRQEAARLSNEPLSEAHLSREKRIRLTSTPALSEASRFDSAPEASSTPPCATPAFIPSPLRRPDRSSTASPPVYITLDARAKLESELEQRGCRPNLWDAWIP